MRARKAKVCTTVFARCCLLPLCVAIALQRGASKFSIGSLQRADSDWLVPVGLDNARISCRISASRSVASGDTHINVIDAADLRLCLLSGSFFADSRTDWLGLF